MFDFLIQENGLMEKDGKLRKYGLDDTDIIFIKELIYGPLDVSSSCIKCFWAARLGYKKCKPQILEKME